MAESTSLHRRSIVIDAACPLLRRRSFVDWYIEGGVTACAPTVGSTASAGETLRNLGAWLRLIDARADLTLVRESADIVRAKDEDRLGLIFHFQGADPIEGDLDLVDAYAALGVRVVQLAYNVRNRVGDGCEEPADAGLSNFGRDLISRLNESGIVVDGAHSGVRTTLEAIEVCGKSGKPFVFSHANPHALHDHPRNVTDVQMKACAATGGVIGINGFPWFIGASPRPTLADYIRHVDYAVERVGIDHVGLGLDYFEGMHPVAADEEASKFYQQQVAVRRWGAATYPPPPYYYPAEIATPRAMPVLTEALQARGWGDADIVKVIGGNWLRVYRLAWGA
ncbi:MAG: membrane dipeptidase [Proteobacteria bacterium]|nr:membrane dipeptidase [Burkholderiales bacterium]